MVRTKTLKKNKLYPPKYYRGLTKKQALERKKEIKKFGSLHWTDPKAYIGFKTNKYRKTKRRSSYTVQWNNIFPNAKSLKQRSNVTGVPQKYLQEVYNRGMAAWRTGHRPGMTPQAWSYPRVSSFLLCGKTHYGPDSDVVRNAKHHSKTARKWFKRCKPTQLTS
jgi:hypothetical protein